MSRQGYPRAIRLRRSGDYRAVQRGGRRFRAGCLVVCWRPRPSQGPRFGMAVSRRVGGAVTRNRVKRWIRESVRRERDDLSGVDVVFIARPQAASAGYQEIRRRVSSSLARIAAEA